MPAPTTKIFPVFDRSVYKTIIVFHQFYFGFESKGLDNCIHMLLSSNPCLRVSLDIPRFPTATIPYGGRFIRLFLYIPFFICMI
jgi:hypothetical protein